MIVLQSIVLDNMTNGWVDLFINTFEIDTSVTSHVAGEIFSSSVLHLTIIKYTIKS